MTLKEGIDNERLLKYQNKLISEFKEILSKQGQRRIFLLLEIERELTRREMYKCLTKKN